MAAVLDDWQTKATVRLGIATDHGGLADKAMLLEHLQGRSNLDLADLGPHALDPNDDYPSYAAALARRIVNGRLDAGILLCRSGIGMSIAANRFPGVRAALVVNEEAARLSRMHNAANVLVVGSETAENTDIRRIADAWLSTPFSQKERHTRRVRQVDVEGADGRFPLDRQDPELARLLERDRDEQEGSLDLRADRNVSGGGVRRAVEAVASVTDAPEVFSLPKSEIRDGIANLARLRACELFEAQTANVQPRSALLAARAVAFAVCDPGDVVMTAGFPEAGDAPHPWAGSAGNSPFHLVAHAVEPETGSVEYESLAEEVRRRRPRALLVASGWHPRTPDYARLRQIADTVDALLIVDLTLVAGLVAAGTHPNPVPQADLCVGATHGTLRGPRGGFVLCGESWEQPVAETLRRMQGGEDRTCLAAKAVCFGDAGGEAFRKYQRQTLSNARSLADELAKRDFAIYTEGTDVHSLMVGCRNRQEAAEGALMALERAGIFVQLARRPGESDPHLVRLGTPGVTSRGMTEADMRYIADWIRGALDAGGDEAALESVRSEIRCWLGNFPLPTLSVEPLC